MVAVWLAVPERWEATADQMDSPAYTARMSEMEKSRNKNFVIGKFIRSPRLHPFQWHFAVEPVVAPRLTASVGLVEARNDEYGNYRMRT
jgi:hypothetical protein